MSERSGFSLGHYAQSMAGRLALSSSQVDRFLDATNGDLRRDLAASVLVTRGWLNENCLQGTSSLMFWFEILAEFGKDVLNLAIATELVAGCHIGDPGAISQRLLMAKSKVVTQLANKVGLRDQLHRGRGQNDEREFNTLIQVATFKLLATLCLSGDMQTVIKHVAPFIDSELTTEARPVDCKTLLQNHAAASRHGRPTYELIATTGSQHQPMFETHVKLFGQTAIGTGTSKKTSEQDAAWRMFQHLKVDISVLQKKYLKSEEIDFRLHTIPDDQKGSLQAAEKALGYQFSERRFLSAALVHPSYLNETRRGPTVFSNRALATLGSHALRAVLRSIVVCSPEHWWHRTLDGYSRVAGYILSETYLAEIGRDLGLGKMMLTGRGLASVRTDSMEAEIIQACVGAAYLDSNALVATPQITASRPIMMLAERQLRCCGLDGMIEVDAKTLLQEIAQHLGISCSYSIVESYGPDHAQMFVAAVTVSHEDLSFRLVGKSKNTKQAAESDAATLPLRVIASISQGLGAMRAVINLKARSSVEFVCLLIHRLLVAVKHGPAGWQALQSLDLFGAAVLLGGSRSSVREMLENLWDVVSWSCPDRIDALAVLITQNVRRPYIEVREQLGDLSQRLVRYLDAYALETSACMQQSSEFRDLLVASVLASPPRLGISKVTSGQVLIAGLAVLKGIEVRLDSNLDPSFELEADLGQVLEVVARVCHEISVSGVDSGMSVALDIRGDEVALILSGRGRGLITALEPRRMNLMALLAAPANLKVTECGGVEIICQRCIQPSDRRGAWVEAALSGLWRSWGRNEPFIEPYARAAHDLKNVMLAVDNHVTNAYENPGHRFQFLAAAEQSLQRARASSRMLLMLLRQMPQAEYARFSLGPMLKSFAADIHRQVPEGVNLQVTQDSATAEVLGDEYLLHSALENLCKNAIEALDAHGSLRIEWLYDTSAKVVLIEVSDNGPGIPKNTLDAVVEGRPVASNKLNGAGLGLLSVSHVVKLHGGEFSVRSGEYGTVCTISIPILEQQVTSKSTPHSETQVVRRNVA